MVAKNKKLLAVYVPGLATGKYTYAQAAESTGYSVRQLVRLKKAYLVSGINCLENRNKNRVPHNKLPQPVRDKIAGLYLRDYTDVNFSYFRDCLEEFHGIKVSAPTLHSIMHEFDIVSPERHKKKPVKYHRSRVRRFNFGDLIQIDGTPYAWFYKFGNEQRYCMVGAIDDATSKITGLYMVENECLYGYLEILRQTCNSYGVPREIYSDRAAVFCCTPKNKKNLTQWEELEGVHNKSTQWQRVLSDLSINQILAWSPEAKGRVERMWRTLQGQLPQWFKLKGIDTVEKANRALPEYIAWFNEKYGVAPRSEDVFFRVSPENLDDVLCARISRKTNSYGEFSFHSYKWALHAPRFRCLTFELCISERGIFGCVDGKYYPVEILDVPLDGLGETMPHVLESLIYRYMFAYAKEVSV